MHLKSITLHNYRNQSDSTFYFNPFLTVILGENSVGKTNILESIFFILTGRGIREDKQQELITFTKNSAKIEALLQDENDSMSLKIILDQKDIFKKHFYVNKIERRFFEYTKNTIPVVLFTPQLIEALTTEPARRRALFDHILCSIDIEYKKRLNNYTSAITKRNKILEFAKNHQNIASELSFWNKFLVEQAEYLQKTRRWLEDFLNESTPLVNFPFSIKYIENKLTHARLEDTLDEQLRRRSTFIGPQRDDYQIFLGISEKDPFDVEKFGSRSQQRLALLWVILGQLKLYKEKLDSRPILLLDDVFSELDEHNSLVVLDVINKYQTIVTSNKTEILSDIDAPHTVIKL